MRNWHEWFIPHEDEVPVHQSEDEVRTVSGAGHRSEDRLLHLRKKLPPRCARCKQFMGYNSGMHIMLTQEWRVHIKCFCEVVERHLEEGEVIDLTNGTICKIDDFDEETDDG